MYKPAGGGQSAPPRGAPREPEPDPHRARAMWGPLHGGPGDRSAQGPATWGSARHTGDLSS